MVTAVRTILLVEDEEQVLRLAVKVLEMRGYAVLRAGTGFEALILSGSHKGSIDLLLADVELDETMNGCELARLLRRARPEMRVLYTSGYPLDVSQENGGETVRKETQEWLAAFLPKPFTPSTLAENVRRALEEMPLPS
jgi:two-component system cell cycle sensor histidine kinase/response regulator CckA